MEARDVGLLMEFPVSLEHHTSCRRRRKARNVRLLMETPVSLEHRMS